MKDNRFCHVPRMHERLLLSQASPERERLIRVMSKKWVNHTQLGYYFIGGPDSQRQAVRDAFNKWQSLGIGIKFQEVYDISEAEIRIAFQPGGSWSYVGRDVLTIGQSEPTMNIGWDITRDNDTAVHEIGHTLGFPHEHQNPNAGIVWNEAAVYEYFSGHPNYWDRETIDWNILRKIPANTIDGSEWDANSIMHYWFESGLINKPVQYTDGLYPESGLSVTDKNRVKIFYPAEDKFPDTDLEPFRSKVFDIGAGEQVNFTIVPRETRKYIISTFGKMDTVMVLFEHGDADDFYYIAGDDDSGYDTNSKIETRLSKGMEYSLRIRMYHKQAGQTAVMLW